MKKVDEKMDIVFLLDRSGSMRGSETDTIGGYNSYIESQKQSNVKVTTILFDDKYEILHNRKNIKDIEKLTDKQYYVRGCTALLDAIGKTIKMMDASDSKKVMFVITTDGLENSSREYTKEQIKELIEGHKDWEFIYIGADIDSYNEGFQLGIKESNIANYKKTKKGISKLYNAVAKASCMFCADECITSDWKKELD